MIKATNRHTGEVIELPADSYEEVVDAWRIAQEYDKAAKSLKEQLKKIVPKFVNDKGLSEPQNGYMFRVSNIQRMNYDKSVLREVFDEDTLDLFLAPQKKMIDDYLKEHLEELGDDSTKLRKSMIPSGGSYQMIKLEKLERD